MRHNYRGRALNKHLLKTRRHCIVLGYYINSYFLLYREYSFIQFVKRFVGTFFFFDYPGLQLYYPPLPPGLCCSYTIVI